MSQDDVMFNSMDRDIVDSFVKIGYFHTISVFFNKSESSFNSCSERFQFFVDRTMGHRRTIFSISVIEVCLTIIAIIVLFFDITTREHQRLSRFFTDLKTGIPGSFSCIVNTSRFHWKTPGA